MPNFNACFEKVLPDGAAAPIAAGIYGEELGRSQEAHAALVGDDGAAEREWRHLFLAEAPPAHTLAAGTAALHELFGRHIKMNSIWQ